jgi:uncharacterized protein (TIGR03000 family)
MRSLIITVFAVSTLGLLWPEPSVFAAEKQTKARRASVRVVAPTGARLTINGKPTKKATARRFVTRPLEQGKTYSYSFKAEFVRGSKTVTIARTVKLRAGQKKVVSLGRQGASRRYTYGAYRPPSNRSGVSYRFSPGPSSGSSSGRYSTSDYLVWPSGY